MEPGHNKLGDVAPYSTTVVFSLQNPAGQSEKARILKILFQAVFSYSCSLFCNLHCGDCHFKLFISSLQRGNHGSVLPQILTVLFCIMTLCPEKHAFMYVDFLFTIFNCYRQFYYLRLFQGSYLLILCHLRDIYYGSSILHQKCQWFSLSFISTNHVFVCLMDIHI